MTKAPSNKGNKKLTSGWNEFVKPFKQEAKFWWSLWDSAGRPNDTPLFTNMKSSRAQYKYAIRRLKSQLTRFRTMRLSTVFLVVPQAVSSRKSRGLEVSRRQSAVELMMLLAANR